MGLGVLNHESSLRAFPSGGWIWYWMADPDQGFGKMQPGGWAYNILPYIEAKNLHDMAKSQSLADKRKTLATMGQTPLAIFYCPTRRAAVVYPNFYNCVNTEPIAYAARTDYAANAGDASGGFWSAPDLGGDPTKMASGDYPDVSANTGVIFTTSAVRIKDIPDGMSHTYMLGEKYLIPDHYLDGLEGTDNNPLYAGFDWDWERWGGPETPLDVSYQPSRDRRGESNFIKFGRRTPRPSIWRSAMAPCAPLAMMSIPSSTADYPTAKTANQSRCRSADIATRSHGVHGDFAPVSETNDKKSNCRA